MRAKPRTEPRPTASGPSSDPPGWSAVEEVLNELATSGKPFFTLTGKPNRIVDFEPGRRVRVETQKGVNWVHISWIKENWATFQRKGKIRREDVAEPGRRDAFMMALFKLVPGVREEGSRPTYLVLE